ncbi:MAG: biotin--[acetyl-CoA-carboxylase] ligase [Alphaproteobacteria bacterium]|nr:biotin--[acetyl-CoA-carboxylase] ligase [Alphaproteobacteria bacterium]
MSSAKAKISSNLLNDYHLLSFDELDSTNEEAKRIAKGGGHHGAVIWAKKQTAGKGRLGRTWTSSQGNLYVSILLHPNKPMAELSQLSFVSAVAAIEALDPLLPPGRRLQCKWPNDILLGGKKVGGILLESFQCGKTEKGKPWVVVGVGINVESFPSKTEFPATCLKDAGVELVSAKIILSRFVHHFIECYNEWDTKGFAPCRRRWLKNAWGMKQRLKARLADKTIEGFAEGIDLNGSLVLQLKDGKKIQISAADIFPADAAVEA